MGNGQHPTLGHGKVCYIEIPALDIKRSASFYERVFGWQIRQRGNGSIAFDDGVGEVSGTWVVGRKAAAEPALLIHIMVDSVAAAVDAVVANGGKIMQPIGMDAPEVTARFSDPAGNIIGLDEEPGEKNMITVMGATGHTGKKISEGLLESGEKVRALGRSEEKLAELQKAGAEVRSGDTNDPEFLTGAFRGADAVYTLLPTDPRASDYRAEQDRQGEAIVKAIRESGARYVVTLSSLGADMSEGTGVILGLHAQEERLKQLDNANVLLLRPVSFFENFYASIDLIRQAGINSDSVAADLAIPMIAARDIADAAAKALKARDWKGVVVRELLGQRDLSYAEATRILGQRVGKPDLQYVQASYDEQAKALVQAGLSESFARLYADMTRAFNEETIKPRAGRTSENTTPTRFEDFADEWAEAYRAT